MLTEDFNSFCLYEFRFNPFFPPKFLIVPRAVNRASDRKWDESDSTSVIDIRLIMRDIFLVFV